MNPRTLFLVTLAATLFLGALPASADSVFEPALNPPSRRDRELTPEELAVLQRYDQNGDGRLEPEEVQAAHGAMLKQKRGEQVLAQRIYDNLLQKFDVQKRGHLAPEEQLQAVAFLKSERPRIYQRVLMRFDRNGDGQLDAEETANLFATLERLGGGSVRRVEPVAPTGFSSATGGDHRFHPAN